MLSAPRIDSFDWGQMEWLAEGAEKHVSLAKMVVKSGAVSSLHRHDNCNEVIHLLFGNVVQRRAADWIDMTSGDTLTVYAGELHQTRNNGTCEAVMMIAYSSGERHYEEADE